ncbi:cellulase family glycosylhydrolase, partial [Streptomyces sp. NPDC005774]|uniref:cellulase family glycosylhydrolase n=1 Tax=Streptomyces sp. NPDC005774 TaxID=3364728 RepID=UPI00369577C5
EFSGRAVGDEAENPTARAVGIPLLQEGEDVKYTFHFYAASHRAEYLAALSRAADRIPVFVTEFGTQNYAGEGADDFAMAQRYLDLMAEKKIGWVNWNFSDDHRSGAVFATGTCDSNGPWAGTASLKPAGVWVRDRVRTRTASPPESGSATVFGPRTASPPPDPAARPGPVPDPQCPSHPSENLFRAGGTPTVLPQGRDPGSVTPAAPSPRPLPGPPARPRPAP